MATHGYLRGIGAIAAGGIRYDDVPYDIAVTVTSDRRSAAGIIKLSSTEDAQAVFHCGNIALQLSDGQKMKLAVRSMIGPDPTIEVTEDGEIPGY